MVCVYKLFCKLWIVEVKRETRILWHVDPLLRNYREVNNYATAVTK
jgi:hypothetical protein